jgi:hypothetical protein
VDLGKDPHASALVAAIVAMADALGIQVMAEGAETADQLASLKGLGCQRVQGYIFARPMSAGALEKLMVESHHFEATVESGCHPRSRVIATAHDLGCSDRAPRSDADILATWLGSWPGIDRCAAPALSPATSMGPPFRK